MRRVTGPRLALVAFAVAFGAAELARPTRVVLPKRTVAGGLVLRSQGAYAGTSDTLDPELLDDLPRIHPDALGNVSAARGRDGRLELRGWIGDPDTRAAGIAVFPIVDGRRIANVRTTYGLLRPAIATRFGTRLAPSGFHITLATDAAPPHARIAVGLIAADRRGYFLLGRMPPSRPRTVRDDEDRHSR